jgi:hypothetical protein
VTEPIVVHEPQAGAEEPQLAAVGSTGPTGHSPVDTALDAMSQAATSTPAEQVEVYESVYAELQETLRTIEES